MLAKLNKLGIIGKMLQFCEMYLKNRKFRVIYNGKESTSKTIEMGVPKGEPLVHFYLTYLLQIYQIWKK